MADIQADIAGASQDLQTIEDFVNLPAGSDVRPRLLPSVNVGTLAGAREAIFKAGGLPAEPFETKAQMVSEGASLPDGQLAMVHNDTADNGLYVKTAGAWVKSAYDPTTYAEAYADKSISNAIAEIVTPSKNLFNAEAITPNSVINALGEINTPEVPNSYAISEFIKVEPSAEYTISGKVGTNAFIQMAEYDSNKVFIRRTNTQVDESGIKTFTMPSNVNYVRFNITSGLPSENSRMFNKGGVISYEPYTKPTLNNVKLADANLLEIKEADESVFGGAFTFAEKHVRNSYNMYNPATVTPNSVLKPDGTVGEPSAPNSYTTSDYISVLGGTTYTISSKQGGRYFLWYAEYDENKVFIRRLSAGSSSNTVKTITTTDNTRYLRLSSSGNSAENEKMLTAGSALLAYQNYGVRLVNIEMDLDLPEQATGANAKVGENIYFTGDRYKSVLLDITDSHTASDPIPVLHGRSLTPAILTEWWDSLVTDYPEYVTKTTLGMDASGTYPIDAYRFTPSKPYGMSNGDKPNNVNTTPRVVITAHHIERLNQVYPFLMMREICKSWASNPVLASLRHEVEFLVFPNMNPWGLANGVYNKNSEGFSTNADWAYDWAKTDINGNAPFALVESRLVAQAVESFKPHVMLDCHSHTASEDGSGVWINSYYNERQKLSATQAVTSLYPKLLSKDAQTPNIRDLIEFTSLPNGTTLRAYSYMLGTTGGLIEIAGNYKGRPKEQGLYNDGLVFAGSVFTNIIVNYIAEYRDYGSPNPKPLYKADGSEYLGVGSYE